MEDLVQDQDTVIQQLRLLLAAKEEELHALKGRAGAGPAGESSESIAARLVKELEAKKLEIAELSARLRDQDAKAGEKLARMAAALEEKEAQLASMQDGPAQVVVEDEEARRRIEDLEERLQEKEAFIREARAAAAAAAEGAGAQGGGEALEEARAEARRLGEELRESRIVRANLEHAAEERDRARAEAAALAGELSALRDKFDETERGNAARVAELQQRLDLLQGDLDAAAAAGGGDERGAEAESLPVFQRIRTLEAELEDREIAYRTTQLKLHRITQNQQILRGLCAGLCVFLIFIISMKARQADGPAFEVAHETRPLDAAAPESVALASAPASPARSAALDDGDFLPFPEAGTPSPGPALAEVGPKPTTALALASAVPPAEPAGAGDAGRSGSAAGIAATGAPAGGALPVDLQFVEASTLALGPAPEPVVAPAREAGKGAREKTAPEAIPPAPRPVERPGGRGVPYRVKKGESLWSICQRELGNGGAIGRVARENKIADPNTVKAGDVIYLSRQ
jgi:hypothetical protein